MRKLLYVTVAAALAWSTFWLIGARGVENGLRDWLDDRAGAGWVAEYSAVETRGFPNRFDTTITALDLADPASGLAWTAPFFQLFRLSYEPNHLIAIWPNDQTLATPHQRVSINSTDARGSLVFKPRSDHHLDRASIVATGLQLNSTAGWSADIAEARLATRPSETLDAGVDIGIDIRQLHPDNSGLARLARAGLVPDTLTSLKIDAALRFDAPWDRAAIETRRPAITAIELNLLQAKWGKLDLWMAGDLSVDDAGRASGSITVKAKNWREILELGVALGWVPDRFAGTLESGLGLLATLSGSPETLDAPLSFTDGQVSFGPIGLGTLPPLRLR